jgi:hypothetical protein
MLAIAHFQLTAQPPSFPEARRAPISGYLSSTFHRSATSVAAAGPIIIPDALISFPISRHFTRTGRLDIVQRDRERLRSLVKGKCSSDENPDLPLTDAGLVLIAR